VWALVFGLGVAQSTSSTLFFSAGISDEQHGLFGTVTVNSSSVPPPEGPSLVDPNLHLTTVVSGLNQPTSMAFLGTNDFMAIEKASGKVQHVVNGHVVGTALDLPVNSASERGLLGIALQPNFAQTHGVYLYWTQSSTAADSSNIAEVPLLGNRVDRFTWDPNTETLTPDRNIIMLRAFQSDSQTPCCGTVLSQPMRGNHDGGQMLFGPDGKLYFQIGDQGRRGQLQNLVGGPFGGGQPDDQFGGPAPDNAHLTGSIFRLNPDGTTPGDNPFAMVTTHEIAALEQAAGVVLNTDQLNEVTGNVRKVYSYGRRNGFGMAFDPATGYLWESENGDDAFDELNRIAAGSNGGWIQIMGPADRVGDFKGIEASFTPLQGNLPVAGNVALSAVDPSTFIPTLQQIRWPPSLIAGSPGQARNRLFMLPGAFYSDPEFSWKWAVAPAAIGFAGAALGENHAGNLFVGASRTFLDDGYLLEFRFDRSRQHFAFPGGSKLQDGVDDNDYKFDEGQSSVLIAGKNFGIVTHIVTGPDGNLYVTSLSNGTVYMIH
jgi:glucose/arabinose dehydrogenase